MSSKISISKNKTVKIVFILMTVLAAVISLVIYNAFFTFDRKFTVLNAPHLNICYLISNDYTFKITDTGFEYAGKKNKGTVTISHNGFSSGIFKPEHKMNDFVFGYKKIKNFRIREYLVSNQTIIVDTFEMIEKAPMHLVPERERCPKFIENFKEIQLIFERERI